MTIDHWFINALWLALVAFWGISALRAKRSIGPRSWWLEAGLRLGVIVLVLLALRNPSLLHAMQNVQAEVANNELVGIIGVVVCALGVALATLARVHLGRNWGIPMSRKEDPELVTSGPYAVIRHPIYAGALLAMLGSTLGESVFWLLPLVLFGSYFIYSARREERLMIERFPQQYPAYRRRTKMLLPFVL